MCYLQLLFATVIIGCGGGSSGSSSKDGLSKEFVSLDQEVNMEKGYLLIDGEKEELTYLGFISNTYGIGVFSGDKNKPLVRMISSKTDKNIPDYKRMVITPDDNGTQFDCTDVTYEEKNSTVILNSSVYIVKGQGCKEVLKRDSTEEARVKDIEIKLTDSLFHQGGTRVSITDDKAYIASKYQVDGTKFTVTSSPGMRTYNQVFDIIKNKPEVKTIVIEYVANNAVNQDIMIETARLIRKAGLNTHVGFKNLMHSSGLELFVAGVERTVDDNASIYLNSWNTGIESLDKNDTRHTSRLELYKEMLGEAQGEDFYFFMISHGTGSSYRMSNDEAIEYGLTTK